MKRKSAFLKIRPRKTYVSGFPTDRKFLAQTQKIKEKSCVDRPILIVFGREPETQVTTIFFLGLTRPNEINEANTSIGPKKKVCLFTII